MPRFLIAAAMLLALAAQANAAPPTCPTGPNPPNTPACAQGAVLPPAPTDLMWLQQSVGPARANQMVSIPLSQVGNGTTPGGLPNSVQINIGGTPNALGGIVLGNNQLLVGTTGAPVASNFTPYILGISGGVSGTFLASNGTFQIPPSVAGGNVSNSGTPLAGQTAEWLTATSIQGVNVTGTGNYVKATGPVLVTPNLGTPSLLIGTNISGTGSAFTAGLISGQAPSATIDATNASNISSGTLNPARLPPFNGEICYSGDSLTTEAAATFTATLPWTSGTFTQLVGQTSGSSASFSAALKIGATTVTGCNSLTVNSTTPSTASCTALNGWSVINQPVSIILGAPTNSPVQWSVCAVATHSPT